MPNAAPPQTAQPVLDAPALELTLARIAHEILENHPHPAKVALVGIPSRGIEIARRLSEAIGEVSGEKPFAGSLDISMHRDDLHARRPIPAIHPSVLPNWLTEATVVLVDDVLQSGRTCRAAMDALSSFGRPARIEYAVLIDRGLRELPISPNYCGKTVAASREERVFVRLSPQDPVEGVWLERVISS